MDPKWFWPFAQWFILGIHIAFQVRHNSWDPMEIRVLEILGCVLWTVIWLIILKPWKSDIEYVKEIAG